MRPLFQCGTLSVAVLMTAATVCALPQFSDILEMPEYGLRVPLLERGKPSPVRMPSVASKLMVDEQSLARGDYYEPRELWKFQMHCGAWMDDEQNVFEIVNLSHLPPDAEQPRIKYYDFIDTYLTSTTRVDPNLRDEVVWACETYGGFKTTSRSTLSVNRFHLADTLFLETDTAGLYVCLIRPAQQNDSTAPDWKVLFVRVADVTVSPEAIRTLLSRQLLDFIERVRKTKSKEKEELDPVRLMARHSIRYYREWKSFDGDSFIILTDTTDSISKSLIDTIRAQQPVLRALFERYVPPMTDSSQTDLIRLVSNTDQYVRFVGNDYSWSAGLWIPYCRELVLKLVNTETDTLSVYRHESFHQYLSSAYANFPTSPWLNEGHAMLFENAEIKGRTIAYPENPDYVDIINRHLKELPDYIPLFLKFDYPTFYGTNRELNYALAWGMARYLQFGAPDEVRKPFARALEHYVRVLQQTGNPSAATDAACNNSLEKFTEHFLQYWKESRRKKTVTTKE